MRVVVDPNVIVSAAISPSGTTGRLLRLGFAGHFGIVASPMLLSEARETLLRPKFRRWLSVDMANELLTSVEGAADLVDDPSDVIAVVRDPGDDYLVAMARMASADAIVSGDLDCSRCRGRRSPSWLPEICSTRLSGTSAPPDQRCRPVGPRVRSGLIAGHPAGPRR